MIVRDNEVTLTKKELMEVITECSALATANSDIKDVKFILFQAAFTVDVVNRVIKKIFGEKND